jgi:IS5 family transposase
MLRDRYEPMNVLALRSAPGLELDPVLTQLDSLLDDDTLFRTLKADLATRHPHTLTEGRPSTPVEVILPMLVVKHLYGWSYQQTCQLLSGSLLLRQFCRVSTEAVPTDTTLLRWANLIRPATLQQLHNRVVAIARQLKVRRGRKLRIDGTVVETNIHYPVDSTLLGDAVRLLSRTIGRAKTLIGETVGKTHNLFRDRSRSVRRVLNNLIAAAPRPGEQAQQELQDGYRQLLELTEQVVETAEQVQRVLQWQRDASAQRLQQILQTFIARVEQLIGQTRPRVIDGEQVAASQQLASIFEPDTAIIGKGKVGKPTEFGRLVWLAEVEGGIISRYALLSGNPDDARQLVPSLEQHICRYGRAPWLLVGDGKVTSTSNDQAAVRRGVRRVVLPKTGGKTARRQAYERQRWFQQGRDWRAGIEGRSSGLKRRHKLERCRYHGEDGMERWVGRGIITHNLRTIAQHQANRTARRSARRHCQGSQSMARLAEAGWSGKIRKHFTPLSRFDAS